MRALLDLVMKWFGYLPASKIMIHYGPHQRPGLHNPIDCETAQKLLTGQADRDLTWDVWRMTNAAAAGRKLPAIYNLLADVYADDEKMREQIMKARMSLPTIYREAGDKVTVQITSNIDVSFDTAVSNEAGTLSHMPDGVIVTRRDTGKSVSFLMSPVSFGVVMDDVPGKLRELLIPASV